MSLPKLKSAILKAAAKFGGREIAAYLIMGAASMAVNYGCYFLLSKGFGVHYLWSNNISWIITVLFVYATNRTFVFHSTASSAKEVSNEAALFFAGRLFTLGAETGILYVFAGILGINDGLVKIFAGVVVVVLNYILSKFVIFGKHKHTGVVLKTLYFFCIAGAVVFLFFYTVPQVLGMIGGSRPLWLGLTLAALTALFAWLSAKNFWFRVVALVLVFLPASAAWYIGFKYELEVTDVFFANCLLTTSQEAAGFFTVQVFLFCVAFCALIFVIAWLIGIFRVELTPPCTNKVRYLANISFALLFILSFNVRCYPMRIYYSALRKLYIASTQIVGLTNGLIAAESKIPESHRADDNPPTDKILILHIGESVRGDHAPMNGYARNTMPLMMKEQTQGNLFSFPNAISFSTSTRFSVIGMLTSATIANPVVTGASVMQTLMKQSVGCFAFLSSSTLNPETRHDIPIYVLTRNVTDAYNSPQLAHSLLPQLFQVIAQSKGEEFYLYQGEGSHLPYGAYDQEKFSVFMPVNFTKNADYTTVNAYDNTIVCLDDFVSQIIDKLRDKNAVYIYASDHGEVMGENGSYGRKGDEPMHIEALRNVLFFVWVSDKFKANERAKFANLRANAQLAAISHDCIYHTVLGFYGIRSSEYNPRLDLFSAQAEAFTGPFPADLPAGSQCRLEFNVSE